MTEEQLVGKAIRQFNLKRTGETVILCHTLRVANDGAATNIFLCDANDFVMAVYFVHDEQTGQLSYRNDLPHQYPVKWKFTIDDERYSLVHWIDGTPFATHRLEQ